VEQGMDPICGVSTCGEGPAVSKRTEKIQADQVSVGDTLDIGPEGDSEWARVLEVGREGRMDSTVVLLLSTSTCYEVTLYLAAEAAVYRLLERRG
jgi:hypothetical protein